MTRYRINYKNKETFELLSKYGEINWYSRVLNVLFWTPYKKEHKKLVEELDGVLFITTHYGWYTK